MKKLLLTLITCIFTLSLWAADVSIKEKFTTAPKAGVKDTSWIGDVTNWDVIQVRRNTDVIKIDDKTNMLANWLPIHKNGRGKMQTVGLEGGIKSISFPFARFGSENTEGRSLKLSITAGTISNSTSSYSKNALTKGDAGYVTYSHDFNCKSNVQLTIENTSTATETLTTSGICRILVGDITITPYLLYRNKDVTVGLKQRGYANNGSQDFINNTGNEGSIEFSSSNTAVATVDPETGVITPVSVGDAIITATWSEGASTTYTLHVVDGIIAENFSKVVQTGQTTSADWDGDLFGWNVANVRRGEADTLGLSPRIQGTAMRSIAGSTIISANVVEGGVKHLAFDWRQWASGSGNLNMKIYYSANLENWGEAVAIQSEAAVKASEPHVFDKDIDDGAKGNAYMKLEYTADGGVAILGAMKITPWLLYTTKEATLDTRGENALTFKNEDLIDNTGATVTYSIEEYGGIPTDKIAVAADGTVTVADRYQTGDITVQAKWSEVTTTYTLHVVGKAETEASYAVTEVNKTLVDASFFNPLTITHAGTAPTFSSTNEGVAIVDEQYGTITIKGVGSTTITATFAETANYQGAEVSYTLIVAAPDFYITGIGGWDLKQVAVYGDSYTFENLAADSYALKVTDGESWATSKGYSHLTASEMVAGLYGNNDNNICFTLAEAGNVTVTYTTEVFKLAGEFTPQAVKVKGGWDSWTEHPMTLSLDRKSASVTMELAAADEVEFGIQINNDDYRANQYGFKREYNTESGITGNTGNMKLTSDKAGDYTFTWTFGTNTLAITFPEILVYRVAGDKALMGSDWNAEDDDNAMTLDEGIYSLTKTSVTLQANTYKFKVVGDGTWKIAYPSEYNAELTIDPRGTYDVKFTFNPTTKEVGAEATYKGPVTSIDNTNVNTKAEKQLINGQLIIIKNGVRYNAQGQVL